MNTVDYSNCSTTIDTGLSDFHHLILTIMKTTFRKKPHKVIRYRNYKNYNHENYRSDLNISLANVNLNNIPNNDFKDILNNHAPLKTKVINPL